MTDSQNRDRQFFLVGIGASAGGVQALEQFFSSLGDAGNAAFVIVQHLARDRHSMMQEILQRDTSLKVEVAQDGGRIEAGTVYVIQPDKDIVLEGDRLRLPDPPEQAEAHSIDRFFESVAEHWGDRSIAILLSGSGRDGTRGLQAVNQIGGIAMVQSPETSRFDSMPTNAIRAGIIDEVLSPEDLARTVCEMIRFSTSFANPSRNAVPHVERSQLDTILNLLSEREEIDFSHYKTSTLKRRIHHRCAIVRQPDLDSYIDYLYENEEEQDLLRQDLLIGATAFFRDPLVWEYLQTQILPNLLDQLEPNQQLRIWVSACATGEEAYSMAILVDEALRGYERAPSVKIFATDIDKHALETAAKGVYSDAVASQVSSKRLDRYFTRHEGGYQVRRSLREMLIFAPHDLTKNVGFSRMNLVTCRNVLIYMQPQLQQQVLRLLHFALVPNGILVLGSSESLGSLEEEFLTLDAKWKIFRKRPDSQLSLSPVTRQIVAPVRMGNRNKPKTQPNDRLLQQVFEYSLGERNLTCLLANHNNQLLRVFHNSAQLLEFPVGEAILDITEIVHPDLKLPLSTALHRSKRDEHPVLYTGIEVQRDDGVERVSVRVGPDFSNPRNPDNQRFIVAIEVEKQQPASEPRRTFNPDNEAAQQIRELEYELQQTRENLQVTIEELETTNEEQQATNEELLASNEELQSTNEELQSVNEELYTVNSEHQAKIEELTQLNNDIDNLLRSTNIGVVFLDGNLQVRKFTPASTRAINLRPNDIGRPLAEITNNLTDDSLMGVLDWVAQHQEPFEREVRLCDGEHLLMRVHPYVQDVEGNDGLVLTFVEINDLKQTQRQLQCANEILENLYAASPVGFCIFDEGLRFIRINDSLAEAHGYSVEEHLGKNLRELVPDVADRIEPLLRQVIETNQPVNEVEIRVPLPSNSERAWIVSYYPLELQEGERGVGGVLVDVTQRVRMEDNLRETQKKLTEAQRLAKVGYWDLPVANPENLGQCIIEPSPGFLKICGFEGRQSPILFEEFLDCYEVRDRQVFEQAVRRALQDGREYSLDVCFHRPDGQPRFLNTIGRVESTSEDGMTVKIYGVVVDVSDRKRIEAELLRQKGALEEAIAIAQAADSANQAKSEFLANMSHEIRSPLHAVFGAGQLLGRTSLNDRQTRLVQILTNNSQRLVALVNDILDLSKLEARKLRLEVRSFDLNELWRLLRASFAERVAAKQLTLDFTLDPDVPTQLGGDDFRLQQVLSNFIDNALKFTSTGSIQVRVSRVGEDGDRVLLRFSVADTGIGIAKDDIDRLFEPFTQVDSSTTRQYGGTGLGLTICRRIVELMGGTIGVDSQLGEGSCFWFVVPLQPETPVQVSEAEGQSSSTDEEIQAAIGRLRILIVEDRPDSRELLMLLIQPFGCMVDWVENGREALERLEGQGYDLVFMDCQMPELDGYEATRRLREREAQSDRRTVVVGLTAYALQGDREKCLEAGMDDYLSKPLTREALERLLTRWADSTGYQPPSE